MKMNGMIPNLFRGVYDYKATAFSNNQKIYLCCCWYEQLYI